MGSAHLSFEQLSGQSSKHLKSDPVFGDLLAPTISALYAMASAAHLDGLSFDIASGFRSFERQVHIWNLKWSGQRPILDAKSQIIDPLSLSPKQKLLAILHWSALPGASRHHWGSDIDIYSKQLLPQDVSLRLIPSEYQMGGHQFPLSQWLKLHANQYGFFYPYASDLGGVAIEPWHISFASQAQVFLETFDVAKLSLLISNSDILGRELILDNLDMIAERYIFNICPHS